MATTPRRCAIARPLWVRHFLQRADAEGRLLRRLWYGLRREGLVPAGGETRLSPAAVTAALRQLDNQAAWVSPACRSAPIR